MNSELLFVILLAIFAIIYFVIVLPVFQLLSLKILGRKFVIRLGTPWKFSNSDHRKDVLMSFISFMLALALSMFILDYFFPFSDVSG